MFVRPGTAAIPLTQAARSSRRPRRAPASCALCRAARPREFHLLSQGKRGYRWRCKRCAGEAVTRRLQKVKRILVEEAGGCCAVCGYDRCMVNLHFHHVDPTTKSFTMSVASGKGLGEAARGGEEVRARVRELSRRDRERRDPVATGRRQIRTRLRSDLRPRGVAVSAQDPFKVQERVRFSSGLPKAGVRFRRAGRSCRTRRRRPAGLRAGRAGGSSPASRSGRPLRRRPLRRGRRPAAARGSGRSPAEQASQMTGPTSQPQSSKKASSSARPRIANGIATTTNCTISAFQKSRAFKGADTRLARLGG